jgi:hypothetical protein
LNREESLLWKIGPFVLQVQRREQEWLVKHLTQDSADTQEETWSLEKNPAPNDEGAEIKRYVFNHTEESLSVVPRLADRAVVVKTAMPLHIIAKQQIDMYVSTPLWFSLRVHSSHIEIEEQPIIRPSDTWFGSSTMKGELCYASTTRGHLYLDELPRRPHRAITPIKINNQTNKPLFLTQLSLPTPYLSLFDTVDGGLWTETVTLLNDGNDLVKVSFSERPPQQHQHAQKIVKARQEKEKSILTHTFSTLFK